jgi:hypothetical protein
MTGAGEEKPKETFTGAGEEKLFTEKKKTNINNN